MTASPFPSADQCPYRDDPGHNQTHDEDCFDLWRNAQRTTTFEQAFRRAQRLRPELTGEYLRREAFDQLRAAAIVLARQDGVDVVTPGQVLIDRMWQGLPPCDGQCAATQDEFEQRGHRTDCPRGVAIRTRIPVV